MADETARLDAVRRYAVGNTVPEAAFDSIVTLAAELLKAPVALFSVIDADHIWFKSRHGLQLDHMDREPGLCASALFQDQPWLVSNASKVAAARENRLIREFGMNSYAGVPLAVKDGVRLGTLCVMDRNSREFPTCEISILKNLASLIVDRLELRLSASEAADAAAKATKDREAALQRANQLVRDGRLLAAIVQSSQDAIVSKDLNGIVTSWNRAAEEIFGYSAAEMIGQSITRIIPNDRLEEEIYVLDNIRRGQRVEHYETLRRRSDGKLIPISLTVSPIKGDGESVLGASKIARNITERLDNENRIRALLREVNHRVKNQFAVILSMIRQTGKRAQDSYQFETKIRERIMALARSHDLLVSHDWRGAPIADVLKAQRETFNRSDRITASGPSVMLSPMAVQYLGMAFHELGTNATLYGALSAGPGTVEVAWTIIHRNGVQMLDLKWTETGVPAHQAIAHAGFGKTILERITPTALGGTGTIIRQNDGLTWHLVAPLFLLESETPDATLAP
ncbi:PAS domain S-box protein [Mesorhizobium sp. SB112]|uniref:PAS domain S-box protein n=1 Tax=Mesorhizobium sp. SB112 TaxID=3151853 RepID=UPI003263C008